LFGAVVLRGGEAALRDVQIVSGSHVLLDAVRKGTR
jgi:hypothetical protein